MAYIPPHKRHLKDSKRRKGKEVVSGRRIDNYATQAISRLWIVSYADDQCPAVQLEPISCESFERKAGKKPLVLVSVHAPEGFYESTRSCERSPWVSVTEKIRNELETSVQNMMNEMDLQESEEVKPFFVANFGKILFHWRPSSQLVSQKSALETALSQVKRSFYGNVPSSFVEYILHSVIPKIGVDFDEEQEYYHVQIFDKNRPRATLSCKCSAMKMEGKLELHRMQLNQVPQMVVDMSCPEKDLDLRLMLFTKKILKELPHDEMNGIKNIIAEAIIDPDVKGGLRWPQGKETFGDRYTVEGLQPGKLRKKLV